MEIILIGASFIMGYGLEDQDTCASQIQKRLGSDRVLNLATPVYGTRDHIRWGNPKYFLGPKGRGHPKKEVHSIWAKELGDYLVQKEAPPGTN
ncbi:hypothetical protein ACFL2Q_17165, partial [Thermodesulfobacteriota bacterium]